MLDVQAMDDETLDRLVSLAVGEGRKESLDALWTAIEQAEAVEDANKILADKATFRRNSAAGEAARIKERILFQMQARDLKHVQASAGKFARTANGGALPLRITGDYPNEFARVKREPDLEKVRSALKEGEILDFVEVLDRGEHLRLR